MDVSACFSWISGVVAKLIERLSLVESCHCYGPVVSDLKDVGRKSMEWDLNDWRWDSDLFMAAPLNTMPSDCRSRQLFPVGSNISVNNGASLNMVPSDCRSSQLFQVGSNIRVNNGASDGSQLGSDEAMLGSQREKRDLEKRRRVFEVEIESEQVNEEAGSLNLKLGGQVYPIPEEELGELEWKSGKKSKVTSAPSSHAVCQVEDCIVDLTNAKDYHRRHKVCAMHAAKSTSALVGNIMQRFHVLQEFDEGKRSCRRRLAGHNKRPRKTHPGNAATQNDEQGSNYLLVSLLIYTVAHDHACFHGHYSYVHLVEKKSGLNGQDVVDDIPGVRIYRPAMVSMVAIAAVSVCTALLFKSSPEILHSFSWELLLYGSQ
ncbi:Squamosa promoter-binding-like protein 6 [Sesamum alatum]|uniref:Squamosa promoter-binding-like protein 6 n=1 Tax=Sesamum alatum TaxID=300844 RepID=A0AAE1XVE1_9LAMI|nr:Squamosa promoter-binding-like protein 6 [Sesamum alatum]